LTENLVDDLWNNQVSNSSFLNSIIKENSTEKKGGKDDKTSTKTTTGQKPTNCFEIKEAPDEDELETPLSKHKSQGRSTSNLLQVKLYSN
jgi:hypothetical protein